MFLQALEERLFSSQEGPKKRHERILLVRHVIPLLALVSVLSDGRSLSLRMGCATISLIARNEQLDDGRRSQGTDDCTRSVYGPEEGQSSKARKWMSLLLASHVHLTSGEIKELGLESV